MVGAVLVLYNPDLKLLNLVIRSVIDQVGCLIIVDNSLTKSIDINDDKIRYVFLGSNRGIAYAQNVGINILQSFDDVHFVFLIDQDTIMEGHIVSKLKYHYVRIKEQQSNVIGVSPLLINRNSSKVYLDRALVISENNDYYEVSAMISSGSLIPKKYFDETSMFNELMFIDIVDYEWCWRVGAINNGHFYMIKELKVSHFLGVGDVSVLGNNISTPSPFRVYYQYRNFLFLFFNNVVPIKWKIKHLFKYIVKFFTYIILLKKRKQYLRRMYRGSIDGLIWCITDVKRNRR